MTLQKKFYTTLIATSLALSSPAQAQFDELPPAPEDLSAPDDSAYAPPPTTSFPAAVPAPTRSESVIRPSQHSKPGVLSSNQKKRFSRAEPADITSENFPETIESFDFPNVEISDVVQAISELTGKNFIIDSTVRGKITILAPSKITVAEAYKAFLSALAINGFTVVPSGGFLKIRNARSAQRDNIDTYSGTYYPNSDQMITKIVHLKHITADSVQKELRLLTSSYGELSIFNQTNTLIISDFGANIDRVMKIINQLDMPGFEDQLEVIGIKYAKAKDIAELIDKVVNKGQRSQNPAGGFASGVPRFGAVPAAAATGGKQGASYFLVFPEDRTNSLVVVGNKPGISRVKKLISQLDFKVSAQDQGGVYVYYVKHGEAEKIAETLQQVTKDAGPKQPQASSPIGIGIAPQGQAAVVAGIFGGDVTIKADKNTNSLVISASKPDYEQVLSILNKIDIARDQVYVQAIIMEMADTDGFNASGGIVKFNESGGKSGFVAKDTDIANILNPLAGAGSAILAFSEGSINVNNTTSSGTSTISVPSLTAFINFITTTRKTNILSTPQITALDSQEAEIEVGDSVVTGSKVTGGGANSATLEEPVFSDATIKMTIKPFISPNSETIRMEFKQVAKQLSNARVPAKFRDSTQPLATRSIKTNVTVNNGDTAVIGGLVRDEYVEEVRKVPLLGDLPIIGWLFKSKDLSKAKQNMIVFLTPKILRSTTDQKNVLTMKAQERLNFIKQQGGQDPYGATMDKIMNSNANSGTPNGELEQELEATE